ncbi:hypothetical protein B7R87_00875 [Streptomyces tsukubensis]|nr:hypothetical protein B7R87_00875 [Streptomyces tsukubensis]
MFNCRATHLNDHRYSFPAFAAEHFLLRSRRTAGYPRATPPGRPRPGRPGSGSRSADAWPAPPGHGRGSRTPGAPHRVRSGRPQTAPVTTRVQLVAIGRMFRTYTGVLNIPGRSTGRHKGCTGVALFPYPPSPPRSTGKPRRNTRSRRLSKPSQLQASGNFRGRSRGHGCGSQPPAPAKHARCPGDRPEPPREKRPTALTVGDGCQRATPRGRKEPGNQQLPG